MGKKDKNKLYYSCYFIRKNQVVNAKSVHYLIRFLI